MLTQLMSTFWMAVFRFVLYAIALIYGLRLLTAFICRAKCVPVPDSDGIMLAVKGITFFSLTAWQCSQNGFLDYCVYLRLASAILLFCVICSILEAILREKGVRLLIDGWINELLKKIETYSTLFENLGRFLRSHSSFMYTGLAILYIGGLWIASQLSTESGMLLVSIDLLVMYCVYLAYAMNSCRRLFLLLLLFAFLYAAQVSSTFEVLSEQTKAEQPAFFDFGIILIAYVLLWIFTALIADDAPVQMVFKIVNTFTTLIAVVGNILIPVLSAEVLPSEPVLPGYDNGTTLMLVFNIFILPLVAAGYIAQLSKDIYLYLKRKNNREISSI